MSQRGAYGARDERVKTIALSSRRVLRGAVKQRDVTRHGAGTRQDFAAVRRGIRLLRDERGC